MAKMFGKIKHTWFNSCRRGCCLADTNKASVNRDEMKTALTEAEQEMYEERDEKHDRGLCFDPKTKMYGCDYCYNGDDYYDGSELDGVPGVWTDLERLI